MPNTSILAQDGMGAHVSRTKANSSKLGSATSGKQALPEDIDVTAKISHIADESKDTLPDMPKDTLPGEVAMPGNGQPRQVRRRPSVRFRNDQMDADTRHRIRWVSRFQNVHVVLLCHAYRGCCHKVKILSAAT
jgi:hypothetical protein